MKGSNFRSFMFMLLIAFLVWSSSSFEPCMGRRGSHWRRNRGGGITDSSLSKKKGKSHGSHHHGGGSKSKPPPSPSPNVPSPSPSLPLPPPPKPKTHPAPRPSPPVTGSSVFNVLDFGAKGDGKGDDTKAFEAAWASACKLEASTVLVPENYVFLVGPISFSGPYCQANIVFQLDGTIVAPSSSSVWAGKVLFQWILFTKLVGITIQGKGTVDGSGSVWWEDQPDYDPAEELRRVISPLNSSLEEQPPPPEESQLSSKMPSLKPTAIRFYGSFNVSVTGITIQNSPQCHLKFDNCMGVMVHDLSVNSPWNSPNTDGIHLQNTKDVLIRSSNLACGDDCVSIQTGCTNVYIHDINCGPGHGISIGGLGKDKTKACVSNITVRDVNIKSTMTGVRIKTWQGGAGSVQNILFSNVEVSEVQVPIIIDQFYCDKSVCKNQSSAVALSGINYEGIRGTYTVKPVHFACSDYTPCVDVSLTSIELKLQQEHYHTYDPFCWQTFGELKTPTVPPVDCIQVGKPSSSQPAGDMDTC